MPSPPGPNVYVVVSPNPGKETRVAELLRWVADEVKAHEPWVTMYRCMEANDAQGKLVDYYVVFRYVLTSVFFMLTPPSFFGPHTHKAQRNRWGKTN